LNNLHDFNAVLTADTVIFSHNGLWRTFPSVTGSYMVNNKADAHNYLSGNEEVIDH